MISSSCCTLLLVFALLTISSAVHTQPAHNKILQSRLHEMQNHLQASAAYTKYTNSLNTILSGITINPPSIAPTSSANIFNITIADCQQLSTSQKSNLNTQASTVQAKLTQLQTTLNGIPVNGSNTKIRIDLKNLQTYVNTFSQLPTSKCSNNIVLAPSAYQTNINSNRWILGSLTMADLHKDYAQRSMNSQYVTNCPINTPFFTGVGCVDCLPPNNIFNIQTATCESCPTGTNFDLNSRTCQVNLSSSPTTFQTNLNSDRWLLGSLTMPQVTKQYSDRSMKEINVTNCPSSTPFWNGNLCVDCTSPNNLFDISLKQCTSCSSGKSVNSTTRSCEPAVNNTTPPISSSNSSVNLGNPSITISPANPVTNSTTSNGTNATSPATKVTSTNPSTPPTTPNATITPNISTTQNTTFTPNATSPATKVTSPNPSTAPLVPQNVSNSTNATSPPAAPATNVSNITSPSTAPTANISNAKNTTIPSTASNASNETNTSTPTKVTSTNPSTNVTSPSTLPVISITPNNTTTSNVTNSSNITNTTNSSSSTKVTSPSVTTNATTIVNTTTTTTNTTNITNTTNTTSTTNTTINTTNATNTTNTTNKTTTNTTTTNTTNTTNVTITSPANTTSTSNATKPSNITSPVNATSPANATNATTPANITSPANETSPSNATKPLNTTNTTVAIPVNITSPTNITNATTPSNITSPANTTSPSNVTKPSNTTNTTNVPTNITSPSNATTTPNTSQITPTNKTTPSNTSSANSTIPVNSTLGNVTNSTTNLATPNNTGKISEILLTPNISNIAGQSRVYNPSYIAPNPQTPYDIPCPLTAPFFNDTGCIQCLSPNNLFDSSKKSCFSCDNTSFFNAISHNCQAWPPNATNPSSFNKLIIPNGQLPVTHPSDISCPPQLPFYNGSACLICNAPAYLFDTTQNNCSACPDQTKYNETTHKCVVLNNDWLIAKNASRLVNEGMPTAYWNQNYDNLLAQNKNRKDCPADKPFYDGVSCINCTNNTPYFNLDTRLCQSCNGSFVYDQTQRDCIDMSQSSYSVTPSALKMSGSLFAHQDKIQHFFDRIRHQLRAM